MACGREPTIQPCPDPKPGTFHVSQYTAGKPKWDIIEFGSQHLFPEVIWEGDMDAFRWSLDRRTGYWKKKANEQFVCLPNKLHLFRCVCAVDRQLCVDPSQGRARFLITKKEEEIPSSQIHPVDCQLLASKWNSKLTYDCSGGLSYEVNPLRC